MVKRWKGRIVWAVPDVHRALATASLSEQLVPEPTGQQREVIMVGWEHSADNMQFAIEKSPTVPPG